MVEKRLTVTHRGTGGWYGPRDLELRTVDACYTPVTGSLRVKIRTFVVAFRGGYERSHTWDEREFKTKEERQQWFEHTISSPRLRRVWWRRRARVSDSLNPLVGQALTQVTFVHDYLQLSFEDLRLTCEATPEVRTADERSTRYGAPGYADSLVSLIGSKVIHAAEHSDGIRIDFVSGTSLALWESEGVPEVDRI